MTKKPIKPFFKINFEDLEIAENFFDNEKQFSEFLLAVSYYYRSVKYEIKNKMVQRYFETYKKTMDMVIEAKKTGREGGLKSAENKTVTINTLQGGVLGGVLGGVSANNKVLTNNNKEESINDSSGKPEKIDFDILLKFLNKKTGRNYRVVTDKIKGKYHSLLKQGYSKTDIGNAITNAVKAQNHIDNGFQYLTLEFFSRPDKIDMYSVKKAPEEVKPKQQRPAGVWDV